MVFNQYLQILPEISDNFIDIQNTDTDMVLLFIITYLIKLQKLVMKWKQKAGQT